MSSMSTNEIKIFNKF